MSRRGVSSGSPEFRAPASRKPGVSGVASRFHDAPASTNSQPADEPHRREAYAARASPSLRTLAIRPQIPVALSDRRRATRHRLRGPSRRRLRGRLLLARLSGPLREATLQHRVLVSEASDECREGCPANYGAGGLWLAGMPAVGA